MRTTLLLLLAVCLALPSIAEDTATTRPQPEAVAAVSLPGLDACATRPLTFEVEPFAVPNSTPAAGMTLLVCDGVNYPGCTGAGCADPCCYCECRALGFPPGYCSLDCCRY